MTTQKKIQATAAGAADDQNIAQDDQSIAQKEQEIAKNDQGAAGTPVQVAADEPAEVLPENIQIRAVYSLAVRHPDALLPDGRPLIFTQNDAVTLPGYTIDRKSPKRDQWIIDIIDAGYLVRADA